MALSFLKFLDPATIIKIVIHECSSSKLNYSGEEVCATHIKLGEKSALLRNTKQYSHIESAY